MRAVNDVEVTTNGCSNPLFRYVYHEHYDDPFVVQKILESLPPQDSRFTEETSRALLTYEQEQLLFQRMNCLKHLTNKRYVSAGEKITQAVRQLSDAAVAARNEIILANQGLVFSVIHRLRIRRSDFDEFAAEGNLPLFAAVDGFDYRYGYRFSTYAVHAIQRHFHRIVNRAQRQQQREIPIETERLDFHAGAQTEDSPLEYCWEMSREFLKKLTPTQRQLVEARFGLGSQNKPHTLIELGERYGVSGERIRQQLKSVFQELVGTDRR